VSKSGSILSHTEKQGRSGKPALVFLEETDLTKYVGTTRHDTGSFNTKAESRLLGSDELRTSSRLL
jgi:hypothetical protein